MLLCCLMARLGRLGPVAARAKVVYCVDCIDTADARLGDAEAIDTIGLECLKCAASLEGGAYANARRLCECRGGQIYSSSLRISEGAGATKASTLQ
jgi:hypothetical protein